MPNPSHYIKFHIISIFHTTFNSDQRKTWRKNPDTMSFFSQDFFILRIRWWLHHIQNLTAADKKLLQKTDQYHSLRLQDEDSSNLPQLLLTYFCLNSYFEQTNLLVLLCFLWLWHLQGHMVTSHCYWCRKFRVIWWLPTFTGVGILRPPFTHLNI